MRSGRAKKARKTLQHFARTIGLKPPYAVLLDGDFVVEMAQSKLDIRERVGKLLSVERHMSTRTGMLGASAPKPFSPQGRDMRSSTRDGNGAHAGSANNSSYNEQASFVTVKYHILESTKAELSELLKRLHKRKHDKAFAVEEALKWIERECVVEHLPKQQETQQEADEQDDNDDKDKEHTADGHANDHDAKAETATPRKRRRSKQQHESPQAPIHRHIVHSAATASSPDRQHSYPYFVASQDEKLLRNLRRLGTVPILRLAQKSVLLLENPSKASQYHSQREEVDKWTKGSLQNAEHQLIQAATKVKTIASAKGSAKGFNVNGATGSMKISFNATRPGHRERKKQKAKAPNPLSCKKSKKGGNNNSNSSDEPKKKRRRRKKSSTSE